MIARSCVALLLATPAAAFQRAADEPRDDGCVVCHGEQARLAAGGVHARAGVTCVSCHGGTASAMDAATAHGSELQSLADPRRAVESCGGCHSDVESMRLYGLRTDQLSLYRTSAHGRRLDESGDPDVATCVSCHGSHEVLPTEDARADVHPFRQPEMCGRCHADHALMERYELDADTVTLFESSVHGRALLEQGQSAAPSCTDCHGSHGAAPPRVTDVGMVCGHCHTVEQSFFDESPHAAAASTETSVQCSACHGHHAIEPASEELFLGNATGHCGSCHADDASALALGVQLHQEVQALDATIVAAALAIERAGERGLFLGEERGYLDEARGLAVRARTLTHRLSPDALVDIHERARGMVAHTQERLATKDRSFRDRKIFTALFFAVSAAFAIVLLMVSREIGGRWKGARNANAARRGDG